MRTRRIFYVMFGFFVAILAIGVLLTGPASSTETKSKSRTQCEAYAKDYADNNSTGKGVVGEAGKIVGGIVSGGTAEPNDWQSVHDRAYDRCMKEE
jgi:hypothetical protein